MSQTNFIAVFAPPAPVEQFTAPETPDTKDTGFQRFLDDAVHKASPAAENHKPDSDSKDHSPRQTETVNKPENHSTSPEAQEADPTASKDPLHPTQSNQSSSNEASAKELPVDNYQKAIDHLKDLGFDPETIDTLLEFLNDTSKANAAPQLQALMAHLSQLNNSFLKDFLAANTSGQNLLAQQQSRQNLVVDLLKQAGLTDQEARDLIQKFQSFLSQKSDLKEALTDKVRTPAADDAVRRPEVVNQVARETTKDAGSKQKGGEQSEPKANFWSQLDAKHRAQETLDRKSPIEQLLNKAANQPQTHPAAEAGEKIAFKHTTLEKIALLNNLQGIGQSAGNIPDGAASKGPDALKLNADFQIQNINVASENGQKIASSAKASLPENPIYKAPVENRIIDQIVNRISLRSNGSQNEIKIKLDPPSLGTVRMIITASGESVRTLVIAENQAVKQMIENNISQLRDSMTGQGLKMDGFTVLVGGEDNSGFTGQNGHSNPSDSGFSDFMDPQDNPVVEVPAEPVTRASLGFDEFSQTVSVFA